MLEMGLYAACCQLIAHLVPGVSIMAGMFAKEDPSRHLLSSGERVLLVGFALA